MATLIRYRQLIQGHLSDLEILVCQQPRAGVEKSCVFDEIHDRYLLVNTGWEQGHRVDGITLDVRIRDDKTWVEEDWSEGDVAEYLVHAGVPRRDIVLGFQPPSIRCYTEFAVA